MIPTCRKNEVTNVRPYRRVASAGINPNCVTTPVQARKGEYTYSDDERAEQPCSPRPPSMRHGIEFNRQSKKRGDLFPRFIGWCAVEVRTFSLFSQSLDLGNRQCLAHFLRESGSWGWRRSRSQRVNFVSVEPHEMAALANVDVDLGSVR